MKAYKGSRGVAPLLSVGTKWKRVFDSISRPLYAWERSAVSVEHVAGRAQEPVWTIWRREHVLLLPGFEPRTVLPVG
jgi:hypothetical protein